MKASGSQAQPACAGVRWAGIGAVAVRRDELDGTGAELTIPMTVPTSCRAYRADARSAGRDICGNQDLHVPVLQRARDMQVFLYIPRKAYNARGRQKWIMLEDVRNMSELTQTRSGQRRVKACPEVSRLPKAKQVYNKKLEAQAAERWRTSRRGEKMRQVDPALPSTRFQKLVAPR